jgi:hypothetical protein
VAAAVVVVAAAVVVVAGAAVVVVALSSPHAAATSEKTANTAKAMSQGRRLVMSRLLPLPMSSGAPPQGPSPIYPIGPARAGHQ